MRCESVNWRGPASTRADGVGLLYPFSVNGRLSSTTPSQESRVGIARLVRKSPSALGRVLLSLVGRVAVKRAMRRQVPFLEPTTGDASTARQ